MTRALLLLALVGMAGCRSNDELAISRAEVAQLTAERDMWKAKYMELGASYARGMCSRKASASHD